MKSNHGWSFIELMLVVVLIAGVVTITLPNIRILSREIKFQQYIKAIEDLLRWLHDRAVLQGEVYCIEYRQEDSRFQMFRVYEESYEPVQNRWNRRFPLSMRIDVTTYGTDQDPSICCYPNGSCTAAEILVEDEFTRKKIELNPLGRTSLSDEY